MGLQEHIKESLIKSEVLIAEGQQRLDKLVQAACLGCFGDVR